MLRREGKKLSERLTGERSRGKKGKRKRGRK